MKSTIDRCPVCKRRKTRSHEANRRYWMLIHLIADKLRPDGQAYSAEQWHTWAKSRWLGCDEIKMPNGKALLVPRSSADLDVAQFSEYMTQAEAWAGEHDVFLEDLGAA